MEDETRENWPVASGDCWPPVHMLKIHMFHLQREVLWTERRSGHGLTCPSHSRGSVYGVLWGPCLTLYIQLQTNQGCGWHLLHCQERRGGPALAAPKWYPPLDQVHSGGGGRGETPFPWHPVEEEWWRQYRHHCVQEANSHGQILELPVPVQSMWREAWWGGLYDRCAKNIMCSQHNLQKEEQYLAAVLRNNGYPAGFISRSSDPTPRVVDNEEAAWKPVATAVIPYVVGMSEDIGRICRGRNIGVAFRSSRTLQNMLSSVKDKVPAKKQSGVVYKIMGWGGLSWSVQRYLGLLVFHWSLNTDSPICLQRTHPVMNYWTIENILYSIHPCWYFNW